MAKFSYLKIGDEVTRILAGKPMKLIVGFIAEGVIHTGSPDGSVPWEQGWKFNIETGAEIDEDLGWDGLRTTGSFLVKER